MSMVTELKLPAEIRRPVTARALMADAGFLTFLYPGSRKGYVNVQIQKIDNRKVRGVLWITAKVLAVCNTRRHRSSLTAGQTCVFVLSHSDGTCNVPDKAEKTAA